MAAIDFPASPTVGQQFVAANGVTYTWNGTLWLASGASVGGDFCASHSSSYPGLATSNTTLVLTQVISGNANGEYSTSTGRYTPPAGRYSIKAWYAGTCPSAGSNLGLLLRKNGTTLQTAIETIPSNTWATPVVAATVDANGTDWFDIQGSSSGGAGNTTGMAFSAFPISGIKGPPGDATPGTLIQTVSTQTGAVATGTTLMFSDDTIPQIGEGDQYMTLAITPRSATSKLVIEVVWNGSISVGPASIIVALFQDSTANALAATVLSGHAPGYYLNTKLTHAMTSGTTSTMTFRVRAGSNIAGTTTFNGDASNRRLGGVMASSIVIQEVAP